MQSAVILTSTLFLTLVVLLEYEGVPADGNRVGTYTGSIPAA